MERGLEGWCTDPFGRHQARWMSDGVPTALIRDGEIEGHDPPPDEPFSVPPVLIEEEGAPSDLRRADDAEGRSPTPDRADDAERRSPSPDDVASRAEDAAWGAFGETMP